MKDILLEVYRTTKRISGIDPSKPGNLQKILVDDAAFSSYVEGLAESIEESRDQEIFKMLAENTRVKLLENSMFAINPYETLTLPILRVFYPKLVAKEAITISPMDKPECVKAFIRANFVVNGTTYAAPAMPTDPVTGVSGGPGIGTAVTATMAVPSTAYDVLAVAGITSTEAHLERDFVITAVSADGTSWTSVSIVPAVEGHFSSSVSIGASNDVISGQVDYLNGTVAVSSATGLVTEIAYQVTCSLEENRINPTIEFVVDKVRLYAKDRQTSATWSINMDQDMRALFDVSMQAEIVNMLGQQIALDIDREIINALLVANQRLNGATHTRTFNRTPPVGYTWGVKYWHENIITDLNLLSAAIYTDTNMEAGNTVLCNPLDSAILEDLNGFNYTGTSSINGDLGYRSAVVAGGKWKVLTSAVVPQGKMIVIFKPVDEMKAVYLYAPYVPAILHPYPLGAKPSLTILSRYAQALVRSSGIATLNIGT